MLENQYRYHYRNFLINDKDLADLAACCLFDSVLNMYSQKQKIYPWDMFQVIPIECICQTHNCYSSNFGKLRKF